MKPLNETVAENIRMIMAIRRVGVTTLSKRTGLSRTTITALRSGSAKMVRFDTIEKICQALPVASSDLFLPKGGYPDAITSHLDLDHQSTSETPENL